MYVNWNIFLENRRLSGARDSFTCIHIVNILLQLYGAYATSVVERASLKTTHNHMRFGEFGEGVTTKITVLYNVTPCSLQFLTFRGNPLPLSSGNMQAAVSIAVD